MKKGAIGRVIGDYDSIDTEEFPLTEHRRGETLRKSLRVGAAKTDFAGNAVVEGQAAHQDDATVKRVDIDDDGRIVEREEEIEKITETAEFLSISGEYVVAQSTQDDWLFPLVGTATDTTIKEAQIDMDGLIEANPEAHYWMAGIYNRPGDVESSEGFGEGDVFEDEEFGEEYRKSDKNRIGMEFEFEDRDMKIIVTESGYVQVYRPSDFTSLEFKRLIDEVIWPHVQ